MYETYIITGINGHLGNTVARCLLSKGCTVRGFDVKGKSDIFGGSVVTVHGDITDKSSLEKLFEGLDPSHTAVIHTAGIVTIAGKYDKKVYDVNVGGTKNITDLCLEKGIAKLVHVSSVHAIPEQNGVTSEASHFDPQEVSGLYAQTKSEATQYVLDAASRGLNASVVHPSGIFGPYDYGRGHLTQLVIDFCDGRLKACVKGGYDFVDVRDVASGIVSCCEKGRKGECYILSNEYHEIGEILDLLACITGKRRVKTVLPLWFAMPTAPLSEAFYRMLKQPPLYTAYSLHVLEAGTHFTHEKAERELGYVTRPVIDTLRDTYEFLKTTGRLKKVSQPRPSVRCRRMNCPR